MPGILDQRSQDVSNRMDETLLNDILRQRDTVNAPATLNRPLLMQLMNQMNRGQAVPVSPFPLPNVPKMMPEVPSRENPMFRNFNGGQGIIKGGLEGILNALVGSAQAAGPQQGVLGPQLPANPLARYINGAPPQETAMDVIRRLQGTERPPVRGTPPGFMGVRG